MAIIASSGGGTISDDFLLALALAGGDGSIWALGVVATDLESNRSHGTFLTLLLPPHIVVEYRLPIRL
jgi:hypothetical protein